MGAEAADFFFSHGIRRSLRMTEFVTYQGAFTIRRKTFDWKRSKISMLEFEVVPQSWMSYVRIVLIVRKFFYFRNDI
jgi:hypothetical protein